MAVAKALPGRLAIALGAFLGRLVGRLARSERRRCEVHLAAALGMPRESSIARRTSLAVFDHLGRSAGELAWAWRSSGRVRDIVRFGAGALDAIRAATAAGRGALFVTGHIGNWELLAWAIHLEGVPSAPVGRESYDPDLDALVERWRGRWGARPLRRESPDIAARILEAVGRGISVGVLIDQSTGLPSVEVPFFGMPAPTIVGPARLALDHDIPVVIGWIHRRLDGVHVVQIEPSPPPAAGAADPAAEWTARWTATLERAVRDEPAQWVWMHRRWEGRRPQAAIATAGARSQPALAPPAR